MAQPVLFINHPEKACGVHQFGENVFSAIRASTVFDFLYCECRSAEDLDSFIAKHRPAAIIYNYYPTTLPWLTPRITRRINLPHIGVMHEVTQERVNTANKTLFDFHIAPDPTVLLTNPIVFKTGRLIPVYSGNAAPPAVTTIGSFGFGTRGKGYTHIIDTVQEEFDEAVIRLNIPFAQFGDADGQGARAYAEACRSRIHKPGIRLVITHDFLSQEEVLIFLAGNTLNCFFYEENKNRGISSVIDLALAVDRPVAITKSNMFRHITGTRPSVCIEDNPLQTIIRNGVSVLSAYKKEWTPALLCWDYERIVRASLAHYHRQSSFKSRLMALVERTPARRLLRKLARFARRSVNSDKLMLAGDSLKRKAEYAAYTVPETGLLYIESNFNRILDNTAREQYRQVIQLLCKLCPDEMSRKIPEANVQQAFVFETVRQLSARMKNPRILSVGCYEDTAFIGLQKKGMEAEGIDPLLNYDLSTFRTRPDREGKTYDIIFSTSVIEHVQDDARFVREISELLAPGGFAVLTCDFKPGYQPGDRVPRVDFRFYTKKDLAERLVANMPGCRLYGPGRWDVESPDFRFEGIDYTFATFTVQKTEPQAEGLPPR